MGKKSPSSVGPPHLEAEGSEAPRLNDSHIRFAATLV